MCRKAVWESMTACFALEDKLSNTRRADRNVWISPTFLTHCTTYWKIRLALLTTRAISCHLEQIDYCCGVENTFFFFLSLQKQSLYLPFGSHSWNCRLISEESGWAVEKGSFRDPCSMSSCLGGWCRTLPRDALLLSSEKSFREISSFWRSKGQSDSGKRHIKNELLKFLSS